jgi:hypothetical protein
VRPGGGDAGDASFEELRASERQHWEGLWNREILQTVEEAERIAEVLRGAAGRR